MRLFGERSRSGFAVVLGRFLLPGVDPCDENAVATPAFVFFFSVLICFFNYRPEGDLALGLELEAVVTQMPVFSALSQGARGLV